MVPSVDQLQRKVTQLANLPTLPCVLKTISAMAENKHSSAVDMANLISTDQVLSAKVLRLVNSPVYGFPGRISSVTHAVVLLGFNVIKGLVLGTAVFDSMGKQGQGLWAHSLGCAILSRRLAREAGMADVEEVMIAGLLHDLGKVVLSYLYAEDFETAVESARRKRCHISETEQDVFSVDHTRVAGWLAEEWHFPVRLSDALAFHHKPERAKGAPDVTAAVHVADILARGMAYGFPGDMSMPTLNQEAYQSLKVSFAQVDKVIKEAEMEYVASLDIFLGGE